MGSTLTHGVYLPDEGERNCYNGLAGNWQLLDNSVGTIAEHTTALAGKAPAVHTHSKADITDFPVYGNTAGTICEGNDSRLSDARTPVAHTHVTSDVTDLLSGDHTWSGNNTYSKTVAIERSTDAGNFLALKNTAAELGSTPASATPATIAFRDKNDDNLGYMGVYYDTDGSNHFRLYVRNKFTSGAPSTSGSYDYAFFGLRLNADKSKEGIIKATFRPYDNNTHDLGSSSYQWNNVYAKGYYYNGVAWGLDKANVWTRIQEISVASEATDLYFSSFHGQEEYNTCGTSNYKNYNCFLKRNSNRFDNTIGIYRSVGKLGDTEAGATLHDIDTSFAYYDIHIAAKYMQIMQNTQFINNDTINQVIPSVTNTTDLGTSTNKWKSLNGINPGLLSFPGTGGFTDIKGDITNLSGGDNTFTAPYNGWVCVRSTNATVIHIINTNWAVSQSATRSTAGTLCCLCPVMSGQSFRVIVNATSLEYAYIHPCAGNV